MDPILSERARKSALFIISHKATLREAEESLGISRSTIDRDINIRLAKTDPVLAEEAIAILRANKAENRANIKEIRKEFLAKRN